MNLSELHHNQLVDMLRRCRDALQTGVDKCHLCRWLKTHGYALPPCKQCSRARDVLAEVERVIGDNKKESD